MTSQCGPQCPNLNETKMRRHCEVTCWVGSNNPIFYPFSVKINRCSGNCNSINDPYAKICIPDVVKKLNIKVDVNVKN